MTGPDHWREAEAKLALALNIASPQSGFSDEQAATLVGITLQRAQVHATLALTAATVLAAFDHGLSGKFRAAWHDVGAL